MHWNAEGVNSKKDKYSKKIELEHILNKELVGVCCLQETHLNEEIVFKIRGYQCHQKDRRKGRILTLIKNNINACQLDTCMEGAEYQMIQIRTENMKFHLLNYYCPNERSLALDTISIKEGLIVCRDFNSHSQSWCYDHMDRRGEDLENWQDDNRLILINQLNDQPTFNSRSWHTTSTPDLAFYSTDLGWNITRIIDKQFGGSDHRPVFL
jgi:hypothetical protein